MITLDVWYKINFLKVRDVLNIYRDPAVLRTGFQDLCKITQA